MARLTETQRRELWLEDKNKVHSITQLCAKYGISRTTLTNVRKQFVDESSESASESESGSESSESTSGSETSEPTEGVFKCPMPDYLEMEPEVERPAPPPAWQPPIPQPQPQAPQPQAPQPQARYEVTKECLFLQDKIKAFVHSFHHKLGTLCGSTEAERERWVAGLSDLPEERLQAVLDSIKYRISAGGVSDMTFTMFASVTLAIESGAPYVGLDLRGYSDAATKNEQAQEAVMEIMVDRMSSVVFSAEKRLCLILASTAYNVHLLNSRAREVEALLRQPAPLQ